MICIYYHLNSCLSPNILRFGVVLQPGVLMSDNQKSFLNALMRAQEKLANDVEMTTGVRPNIDVGLIE